MLASVFLILIWVGMLESRNSDRNEFVFKGRCDHEVTGRPNRKFFQFSALNKLR